MENKECSKFCKGMVKKAKGFKCRCHQPVEEEKGKVHEHREGDPATCLIGKICSFRKEKSPSPVNQDSWEEREFTIVKQDKSFGIQGNLCKEDIDFIKSLLEKERVEHCDEPKCPECQRKLLDKVLADIKKEVEELKKPSEVYSTVNSTPAREVIGYINVDHNQALDSVLTILDKYKK